MKKSLLYYTVSAIIATTSLQLQAVTSDQKIAKNPSTISQKQQTQGFKVIAESINKSPADKAIYQGIQLDNGMTVLLISDPKANKSLMSAALPFGSMDDPKSQQGLAHYLEHMILMGSKKYPETNGLDKFLNKNGGRNNASTASNRTAFYLEVNNNAFDEAVARLADILAEPTLVEENAKKELNAVNAEMVRAKSNDGHLLNSVNLATANPEHPMTKFAVGNKETLKDKPNSKLQTELEKFYQDHYSANLVKAVLYSNQSIEQLAKLATQTLGTMKNKNLQKPSVNVPLYRAEDKGITIHYKPVQPTKLLAINFDYPNDEKQFKHKTNTYLAYVLNNNTDGTLSDYLIKNGLSDSGIQANADPNYSRNRGDFTIYVALTDKGLAEKDKVISLIFQQIEAVKKSGIQESYFKEMKQSLAQSFEHLQIEKTMGFVEGLTDTMLEYPLENVIDAGFETTTMDKKAIEQKLAGMTLDNARILLVTPNEKTDKKTPYMNAGYSVEKFSEAQKSKWLDFSHNPELKLPELNPYFATDFSLNNKDNSILKPQKIEDDAGSVIYSMPSHYFPKEPKANISLGFSVTPKNDDLKPQITATLLSYMNELSQTKLAFQSSVAGMGMDFSYYENGIGIALSGYTQNLEKLLRNGLTQMSQFELKESDLAQAKQRVIEALDRLEKDGSLKQAARPFANLTSYPYYSVEKQRKMVTEVTMQDIEQLRERLLTQATGMKVISVGNLNQEQVKSFAKVAESVVKNAKTETNKPRYVDFSQASQKISYVKKVPNEDNALALVYLVKGNDELTDSVRAALIRDIISRWYFNDLRTDKQLGYVVYANSEKVGKTSGLKFMVQSPNTSPKGIMEHNNRFFKETYAKLQKLTDKEFEQYRNSLLEKLNRKPESLGQEFERYAEDFSIGNLKFDRLQQVVEITKKITKQQVIDFYKQAVIDQSGFVFASQTLGTKSKTGDEAQFKGFKAVTDIEALQKTLPISHW